MKKLILTFCVAVFLTGGCSKFYAPFISHTYEFVLVDVGQGAVVKQDNTWMYWRDTVVWENGDVRRTFWVNKAGVTTHGTLRVDVIDTLHTGHIVPLKVEFGTGYVEVYGRKYINGSKYIYTRAFLFFKEIKQN